MDEVSFASSKYKSEILNYNEKDNETQCWSMDKFLFDRERIWEEVEVVSKVSNEEERVIVFCSQLAIIEKSDAFNTI